MRAETAATASTAMRDARLRRRRAAPRRLSAPSGGRNEVTWGQWSCRPGPGLLGEELARSGECFRKAQHHGLLGLVHAHQQAMLGLVLDIAHRQRAYANGTSDGT